MTNTPTIPRLPDVVGGAAINIGAATLLYDPDARMMFLILVLALWGGGSRTLSRWRDVASKGWAHVVASIMSSVFAAVLVGLFGWWLLRESYPTVLLGLTGLAAWLGIDVLDPMAARASRVILRIMPKAENGGEPE